MKKIYLYFLFLSCFLFSLNLFSQVKDSTDIIRSQKENVQEISFSGKTIWEINEELLDKNPAKLTEDDELVITKTINFLREENERLNIIISSFLLNPIFREFIPQYIIEDEELQIAIVNQLKNYYGFSESIMNSLKNEIRNGKIKIRVIQRPLSESDIEEKEADPEFIVPIIGLYLNDNYMLIGEKVIENTLSQDLYNKLTSNLSNFKLISRTSNLYKEPKFATTDISISGGALALNLQADTALIQIGANVAIGYDILNLPFWYGAVWNVSAFYRPDPDQYYMLGTLIPFRPGDSEVDLVGPIQLKSRKLNGTYGISAEFGKKLFDILLKEDEWEGNSTLGIYIGGSFSYSDLKKRGDEILVDINSNKIGYLNNNPFYYIGAHYIGFLGFEAPDLLKGLHFNIGYGAFAVHKTVVEKDGESLKKLSKTTISDLYAKLTYAHEGITDYTISAQYFNQSLMLSGILKVFSWLGLEVKYARVVGRDPDPYEYRDYVTVSPRFSFSF